MQIQKYSKSGNSFYGPDYSQYHAIIPALTLSTLKLFYGEILSMDYLEVV